MLSFVKCFKTLKQNICFSCRSLRWKILVCVQCKTAKKFISSSAFLHLSFTITTEDGERTVNLVFGDEAIKSTQCHNPQQYLVAMNPGLTGDAWRLLQCHRLQAPSPLDLHILQLGQHSTGLPHPCRCLCYWTSAENPSPCSQSFKIWRLFPGQMARVKLNWRIYFAGELRCSLRAKAQM